MIEDIAVDERTRGGPGIHLLFANDDFCRAVMVCAVEVVLLSLRDASNAASALSHAPTGIQAVGGSRSVNGNSHPGAVNAGMGADSGASGGAGAGANSSSASNIGSASTPSVTLPTSTVSASATLFPWSLEATRCPPWAFQRAVEIVVRSVAELNRAAMRHLSWYSVLCHQCLLVASLAVLLYLLH